MPASRRFPPLGTLIFSVAAAFLFMIVLYGIFTSRDSFRPWEEPAEERFLASRSAGRVTVEMRIVDLGSTPRLRIEARGLAPDEGPLEIHLFNAQAGHSWQTEPLPVPASGRIEKEIALPPDALHRYRTVVGMQSGTVLMRAPLT